MRRRTPSKKKKPNKIVQFFVNLKKRRKRGAKLPDNTQSRSASPTTASVSLKTSRSKERLSSKSRGSRTASRSGKKSSGDVTTMSAVTHGQSLGDNSDGSAEYGIGSPGTSKYDKSEYLVTQRQPPLTQKPSYYANNVSRNHAKSEYAFIKPPSGTQADGYAGQLQVTASGYDGTPASKPRMTQKTIVQELTTQYDDPVTHRRQLMSKLEAINPSKSILDERQTGPVLNSSISAFDLSQLIQLSSIPSAAFDYGEKRMPDRDPIEQVAAAIIELKHKKAVEKVRLARKEAKQVAMGQLDVKPQRTQREDFSRMTVLHASCVENPQNPSRFRKTTR